MVLKKSNWHTINSGNTMKKRYYRQLFYDLASKKTHVIKTLMNVMNIRVMRSGDGRLSEVDAAEAYFDDGNLTCNSYGGNFFHHSPLHIYSLNKKKRWLLEDVVGDAVHDEELAEKPFKVTLVHRKIPVHGVVGKCYIYSNVVRYYDSHSSTPFVETNGKMGSTRFSLIQKGNKEQKEQQEKESLHQQERRRNHNQHFRGIQRKTRTSEQEEIRAPFLHADDNDNVPEIRYETAEPEQLNSKSFKHWDYVFSDYTRYCNKLPGTRFRGFHKEKVEWYYTDGIFVEPTDSPRAATITENVSCYEEEEEEDIHWRAPPLQEYSLLDLAIATQSKTQWKSDSCSRKVTTESAAVNTASSQFVRKYGKGEALYLEEEPETDGSVDMDETVNEVSHSDSERDTDNDSGLQSGDDTYNSSLDMTLGPTSAVDYEEELTQSDKSFCTGQIPEHELTVSNLCKAFGAAVAFGKCVPLTVNFDLHAVAMFRVQEESELKREVILKPNEWWLMCQAADTKAMDSLTVTDTTLVKMRLHGNHDECDVALANQKLWQLVTEECQPATMSIDSLLVSICNMLDQMSCSRWTVPCSTPVIELGGCLDPSDIYLPHEKFTERVEVCSVTDAYHQLKSSEHAYSQAVENEDLELSNSLTWCEVECSVCFSSFDDSTLSREGFTSTVTMTTCGHSFCRQCWQRHLLSCILEGQTILHCMEYKCKTVVDSSTLMSLVPHWVYTKWQERLHNKAVESSGMWNWCPNARCGLLARAQGARVDSQLKTRKGVPVLCECQKRWCLDCKRDAHWPLTCAQFTSYTKMLKQHGDENGQKSSYTEITTVLVKRCPGCNYPMQKNGGCFHMSCIMCHKSFCWTCLRDWSEHCFGDWRGCSERGEQSVELGNEKVYPLPIECYKKAVSYRYTWKELDRARHRTVEAYHNLYACLERKSENLVETFPDAVNHVAASLIFLRKSNILLEMSYVLLSNSPRRHQLAKSLRAKLALLQFISDRVVQLLAQPMKQVLKNSGVLHKLTDLGNEHINNACYQAYRLVSKVQDTAAQEWLLQADHECFVKYK